MELNSQRLLTQSNKEEEEEGEIEIRECIDARGFRQATTSILVTNCFGCVLGTDWEPLYT